MARIPWTFTNRTQAIFVTSQVMSFTRRRGRESIANPYPGQQMTVTIRNDNQQVDNWRIGDRIQIKYSSITDAQDFWVTEVQYNDAQGTTTAAGSGQGSTATIVCDDFMARAGRIKLNGFSFTADTCFKQVWNQVTVASGVLPSDMSFSLTDPGFFDAQAQTYTGSLADKINLALQTEGVGGLLYQREEVLEMRRHNAAPGGTPVINAVTLQPAKGSSTGDKFVVYSSVERIAAGQTFINSVTVEAPGLANQTQENSSSVAAYGRRSDTVSTINTTTLQASNRASWLANSNADPYDLRFEVRFSDVAQTNDGAIRLIGNYSSGSIIYLKYVVPGSGTTTTIQCTLEGIAYSGTPDKTEFTAYLSPASLYLDGFVLDWDTQGVLDFNRLGTFK